MSTICCSVVKFYTYIISDRVIIVLFAYKFWLTFCFKCHFDFFDYQYFFIVIAYS